MAQKVVVLSPLHNSGASTVAALIAHNSACKGKSSMLCYTDAHSPLPEYFGIEENNDPTRTIMQVTKLIDAGGLTNSEILQYADKYDLRHEAYILNTADPTLDDASRKQIIKFIFAHTPTNLVVCDVSEDMQDIVAQELIEDADGVFIVIQPTQKYYARVRAWLQDPILVNKENVYVLVNGYHEVITSARALADKIGIKAVSLCKVHYNPWICKCCHIGSLEDVVRTALMSDPRTVNLQSDFTEIDGAIKSINNTAPSKDNAFLRFLDEQLANFRARR